MYSSMNTLMPIEQFKWVNHITSKLQLNKPFKNYPLDIALKIDMGGRAGWKNSKKKPNTIPRL